MVQITSPILDDGSREGPCSSTPWPRQRGHELRPVVSHFKLSALGTGVLVETLRDLPHRCIPDEKRDYTCSAVESLH